MPFADLRPPKVPEEDPELREQLHEVLNRLERIELAVGVEEEAGEEEPLTAAEDAAADLAETGEEQQRKRSQTE